MAWTVPKTWESEPLTSNDMNTHIRDNLNALKTPPSVNYVANEGSDYTTSSSSFVNVDGTNTKFAFTLATNGGDVMVHFHGSFSHSNPGTIFLDVEVDSARHGGDDGIALFTPASSSQASFISFTRLITGLAAGSHTFKLQWKTNASGATFYAGAGTANRDNHPQFWIREVS